jgi:inosine/xanthosine triphosphatase
MYIIVGSQNPVKIAAVRAVLPALFASARIEGNAVPSGVSAQPRSDAETRQGARNRAQAVLATSEADLAIGLEGGVTATEDGLMTCAWCVVLDRTGQQGIGGGAHVLLPPAVAHHIQQGTELGHAMDMLVQQHNTRHGDGAIGILTGNLINRQASFEVVIRYALAPFRRPQDYRRTESS